MRLTSRASSSFASSYSADPTGASVEELQAATGWQAHSARGFLSGTVKKKLRLTLSSDRPSDGPRRYRVGSEA